MTTRPIVIVRPGPVMVVYQNGKPVVEVELSAQEAVSLLGDLAKEVRL